MLRAIPSTEDGDFTVARFDTLYTADLADQLANLVRRVVRMIQRYTAGKIPAPTGADEVPEQTLKAMAAAVPATVQEAVQRFARHEALANIWAFVGATNSIARRRSPGCWRNRQPIRIAWRRCWPRWLRLYSSSPYIARRFCQRRR